MAARRAIGEQARELCAEELMDFEFAVVLGGGGRIRRTLCGPGRLRCGRVRSYNRTGSTRWPTTRRCDWSRRRAGCTCRIARRFLRPGRGRGNRPETVPGKY